MFLRMHFSNITKNPICLRFLHTLSICIATSGFDVSNIALLSKIMTFVIGASSGKLLNFAKLPRLCAVKILKHVGFSSAIQLS